MKLSSPQNIFRPAWVQVDLDAVAYNVSQLKSHLGSVKLLAVVKADGYGHGAVEVARTLEQKVDYLGVVMLEEAYELRKAGINAPILNTAPVSKEVLDYALELDIEQTIDDLDSARNFSKSAEKLNKKGRVHIKVDTGMSRYGLSLSDAVNIVTEINKLPNIDIVGIFSHFPMSDGLDKSYALLQIERMMNLKRRLKDAGMTIPLWHMANSGGALDLPTAHFDMVRVGLLNYGYWPSFEVRQPFDLRPAMSVKARISTIRTIQRGDSVGYGRKFMAEAEEDIAVLPIGYADGYDRKLSQIGHVLWRGKRVPIIGGLCMDAAFIRVTEHPEIQVGDEVTLMGIDGEDEISPHEIAQLIGSVSYEVISRFGRRLPRVYLQGGQITIIRNRLTE